MEHNITPLRWYGVCVVVQQTMLQLWMAGEQKVLQTTMPSLPLDGHLSLGSDQVSLNGGLDFSGQLTLLNIWDRAFTAQEQDDWGRCRPLNTTPFIGWDDFDFSIHNGTAGVILGTAEPCQNNSLKPGEVFLFTFKLKWEAVVELMKVMNMWPDSHNFSYQEHHENLLAKYSQECKHPIIQKPVAWTGLLYNCSSNKIENVNGLTVNARPKWYKDYKDSLEKETCKSPLPLIVGGNGYWYWMRSHKKVCSFAERPNTDILFNLRLKCEGDGEHEFSYINFVLIPTKLSKSKGGSVYLHGLQPFVIEDDNNNGTWCLKKRASTPIYIACTLSSQIPLGIHLWNAVGGPEAKHADPCTEIVQDYQSSYTLPLILSSCTREQFTCNDLKCISLDKVCDMMSDCQEGEDEHKCSQLALVHGYISNSPPASPLPMTIMINIQKISNIDLMNFAMSLSLHVTLSWRESRVQYRHLLPGKQTLLKSRSVSLSKIFTLIYAKHELSKCCWTCSNSYIWSHSCGAQNCGCRTAWKEALQVCRC